MLREVHTHPPASRQIPSRELHGNVLEHLSQLLDSALFESTISARVRGFSQTTGDIDKFFEAVCELASDVVEYRWFALSIADQPSVLVHAHPGQAQTVTHEVEAAFGLGTFAERRQAASPRVTVLADERAVPSDTSLQPLVEHVYFTNSSIGRIALSPSRRGVSSDDKRFLKLLATELGGPLQMVQLVAETKRLANTDGLTGLLNRRAFIDGLESARGKSAHSIVPLSLFLLDIDHFKRINDTQGHDGGDAVLRGVALALASVARKSDLVARWGGEEFVVALPETSIAGARVMAERVRRAIADRNYVLPNGDKLTVTASIGIASSVEELWKLDDVIMAADRAMYNAKNRGRNRVEVA
jgi:two-component system cell cycle response regulator